MVKVGFFWSLVVLCLAVPGEASEPLPGPYPIDLIRVVDGDTVFARVTVWPDVTVTVYIRLAGIDAPEKGEVGFGAAKAFLVALLEDQSLTLHSPRPGKYARRVVGVLRLSDGRDVGRALLEAGVVSVYGNAPSPTR